VPNELLAVNRVSVSYGPKRARVRALDDVTLGFDAGELTLIIGPSGSGKTTLLSLLGCLLTPDRGAVFVEGLEVGRLNSRRRAGLRSRIGFVFQSFRLFHSLSALENVLLPAEISGQRNQRARAARNLLIRVGLGEKLGLKPDALSGGEKQRVAICRALLQEPSFLLADEPTASLDFESGHQIRTLLRQLSEEQGLTVVVVSHDPRWIPFAHRTVVLEDGRIIDDKRSTPCEKSSSIYQPVEV
jgi:putative ABC transport system ATP-binding protein